MNKNLENHILTTKRLKNDSLLNNNNTTVSVEWLGLTTGRVYKENLKLYDANLTEVTFVDKYNKIDSIPFVTDKYVLLSIYKDTAFKYSSKLSNENLSSQLEKYIDSTTYYKLNNRQQFLDEVQNNPLTALHCVATDIYGEEYGKEFDNSLKQKIEASNKPLIDFSKIESTFFNDFQKNAN